MIGMSESDRAYLLDRLLRLEQQLHEVAQERDDWKSIARRLWRRSPLTRQSVPKPVNGSR